MNEQIWWRSLMDTALLGTERNKLDTSVFPDDLRLEQPPASAERALLQTAALAANYQRAGVELPVLALPNLPACPPETGAAAPPTALKLLNRVLNEETPNRRLLGLWLTKCAERNWIVPSDLLVTLLNLLARPLYNEYQEAARAVVGERGRWLSQFAKNWGYIVPTDPEIDWHQGPGADRVIAFRKIRQADPVRALTLLRASWPTESAKDRLKLLAMLAECPTLADEPFVNAVLSELDAVKKVLAAHRDVRAEAVSLLLNLPGSGLFQKTQEALAQYVTTKRELLINKVKVLVLPEQPDTFFNAREMARYGFGTDNSLAQADQIRQWTHRLLTALHPACWMAVFEVEEKQLIGVLKRQNWFTDEAITSFAGSIIRHRISTIAHELLPLVADTQRASLLSFLPQRIREDRLTGTDDLLKNSQVYAYLTATDAPDWSPAFSEWVLEELTSSLRNQYQLYPHQRQFLADLVLVIHPATALARLATESSASDANYQVYVQNMTRNQLIDPLIRWLRLREQLGPL